jgi:hypothetical protein
VFHASNCTRYCAGGRLPSASCGRISLQRLSQRFVISRTSVKKWPRESEQKGKWNFWLIDNREGRPRGDTRAATCVSSKNSCFTAELM